MTESIRAVRGQQQVPREVRPSGSPTAPDTTTRSSPQGEVLRDAWCDGCSATVPKLDTGFGRPHGQPIQNWQTARAEVDRALNRPPPRVSIIATQGDAGPGSAILDKLGLGFGSPGHLLISYLLPSGEQKVMNISGAFLFKMQEFRNAGKDMVSFFSPEEYQFSTHNWWDGNGQGGIYNTRMVEVRLEQDSELVTPEKVQQLHAAYEEVQRAFGRRDKTFALIVNRFLNLADQLKLLPSTDAYPAPVTSSDAAAEAWSEEVSSKAAPETEQRFGNCGLWVTGPAKEAGVMDKSSMWPRLGLAYFYEYASKNDPRNVNVVRWEAVGHVKPTFARDRSGLVAPHRWIRSIKYRNDMLKQTDVVATVPKDSQVLVAELTQKGSDRVTTRDLVERFRAEKSENGQLYRSE